MRQHRLKRCRSLSTCSRLGCKDPGAGACMRLHHRPPAVPDTTTSAPSVEAEGPGPRALPEEGSGSSDTSEFLRSPPAASEARPPKSLEASWSVLFAPRSTWKAQQGKPGRPSLPSQQRLSSFSRAPAEIHQTEAEPVSIGQVARGYQFLCCISLPPHLGKLSTPGCRD